MIIRHEAPHFDERVLMSTLLLLASFFLFALFATQVGLADLLAAREGRPTVSAVLVASFFAVTLAWWRCPRRDSTSPRRIGRGI
jgi:hypothetical protein